jgi:hypothetical protein
MEIALGQLKELRASHKTPIDAHRVLISSLRRIPQDILLAIFPSEHNTLIDPAEAPLLLGRICRHWRDVVSRCVHYTDALELDPYSLPRLYTRVIQYDFRPGENGGGVARAILCLSSVFFCF